MSTRSESLRAWLTERVGHSLSLVRIVTALIFFLHGSQKLLGLPAGPRAFAEPFSLSWWAGAIELVTGVLLMLGLFTRPAAFVAAGTMAFAYWIGHAPRDVFPANNGGDAAILFCFVFLHLVMAGPGPWSVDTALARRR